MMRSWCRSRDQCFLIWAKPGLFCLLSSFSQCIDRQSSKFDFKSVDDVLGIRTRDHRNAMSYDGLQCTSCFVDTSSNSPESLYKKTITYTSIIYIVNRYSILMKVNGISLTFTRGRKKAIGPDMKKEEIIYVRSDQ